MELRPEEIELADLERSLVSQFDHMARAQGLTLSVEVAADAPARIRSDSQRLGQVVKNLLLGQERTLDRKIREALLARRLEQELPKDEILELYLNHIYFGDGNYGIEEAARGTFGKSARELTIAEAALLASLPAGPDRFSPRKHLDRVLERRAFVLGQMQKKAFLSDAQYAAAKDEPVKLASADEAGGDLAPEVVWLGGLLVVLLVFSSLRFSKKLA
jgi:penicillin-binding protein 1A